MKRDIILIIGARCQIGTKLTAALRLQHGYENVIAADKRHLANAGGVVLEVLDGGKLRSVIKAFGVRQIYLLECMLPATGKQQAEAAWSLNMKNLLTVLKIAKEFKLVKVFWPSSFAVFGACAPKHNCPQEAILEPATVYGISKRAGEYWCKHYFEEYGVDVRSLRYPGLISHSSPPGVDTTDYAVEVFHRALEAGSYNCFLNEDTCLPMLYMPDAIRATIELMNAPKEKISVRTSYNLAGMSFAPSDLAASIRKYIPDFKIYYQPDSRQAIADSLPASINDCHALRDWGWKPEHDIRSMTMDMLTELSKVKGISFDLHETEQEYFPDFPIDHCKLTQHYE